MSDKIDTSDQQNDLFGEEIDATADQVIKNIDGIQVEDIQKVYSPRLVEFYEMHSRIIEKMTGIQGEANHKLSAALVSAIGSYFGGHGFYLPYGKKMELFMRDIAIYKASFQISSVADLAKKFRVSHQTIYTALAKQRDLRQRKLPLE